MNPEAEETVTDDEGGFFSIAFKKQTYRNILYLALAGPLGLIYFATIVAGAVAGVGLIFHGVQLINLRWPILLWTPLVMLYLTITLLLTLVMISIERQLASWLFKLPMPKTFNWPQGSKARVQWFVARAFDRATVKGLIYLLIKFPLGVISLAALLVSAGLTAVLMVSPWFHGGSMQVGFGPIYIGATFKILLMLLALVIATMALHLMGVLASFSRACARKMLDRKHEAPLSPGQDTVPIGPRWPNQTRTWDT
ncbi:MAG: sensor domain-containing protein [Thermomicrobiales bacterium]